MVGQAGKEGGGGMESGLHGLGSEIKKGGSFMKE